MNDILTIIYLITFVADVFLIIFSATRKDQNRSIYFTILTAGLSIYSLGCAMLCFAATDESAMNSLRIANAGIPLIAPYFLLISLSMFQPKYLRPWMVYCSLIYNFSAFFIVTFNDAHHLYYSSVTIANGELAIEHGIFYWIAQGANIICMTPAYIILFNRYIKGTAKLRRQMNFILLGSFLTFSANIINFSGILPQVLDPMPIVLTIALSLFVINLSQYHILDIAAIASNTAVQVMSDALIIVDSDWGFLFCNTSAENIFPPLRRFLGTEQVDTIEGWPDAFKNINSPCHKEFERRSEKTGEISTYKASINKIISEKGMQVGWYILITNTTDVTILINRLKDLATTDALTGIRNRHSFLEHVGIEMDMSSRNNLTNALIMFDIDHFKNINDTYGHSAGDYILCSVVGTIQKQLRSYDIIARYGGEEFVIFTICMEEECLNGFANRLCKAIADSKYIYNGTVIPVTASFGTVEIYPGDTFEQAMLTVDAAMYQAKRNGRNQVAAGKIKRD